MTDTETTVEWAVGDTFKMEGNESRVYRVIRGGDALFNVEYKDGSGDWQSYSNGYGHGEITGHLSGTFGSKWTKVTDSPSWSVGTQFRTGFASRYLYRIAALNSSGEHIIEEYSAPTSSWSVIPYSSYTPAAITENLRGAGGAWVIVESIVNLSTETEWEPTAGGLVRVVSVPGFTSDDDKGLRHVVTINGLAVVKDIEGTYEPSDGGARKARVHVKRATDERWGDTFYVDYEQPRVRVGDVIKVTAVPPWSDDFDNGLSKVQHSNGLAVVVRLLEAGEHVTGDAQVTPSTRVEVRASNNPYAEMYVDWEWPTGDELLSFSNSTTDSTTVDEVGEMRVRIAELERQLAAANNRGPTFGASEAVEAERRRIIESLDEEAESRSWCGEYNEWLNDIGLAAYSNREREYTFNVRASFDVTITTNDPSSVTRQDIFDAWEPTNYDIDEFETDGE